MINIAVIKIERINRHTTLTTALLSVVSSNPVNIFALSPIPVPVVFMTSDGRLCPDGFICGENNNRSESRIFAEGYLHYVKRKYMEEIGVPEPTEEDIKNVTIEQLIQ